MNYPLSQKILEEIKKAKKILVNCHRGPDPDSIGSALALYEILTGMGKDVRVVCPSEVSQLNLDFLENFKKIETIDFSKFDFSDYDLFIALDSSSWDMVSENKEMKVPDISIIVIDHHKTNTKFGGINVIDDKTTSTGELLFLIFEDMAVDINKTVATALLTGIIGDTGVFRYHGTGAKTLAIAGRLMEKGADKEEIVSRLYHSIEFEIIKFWGEVLKKMKLDKSGKFVWAAIPYDVFVKYGSPKLGRELAASTFAQIVDKTKFGMIMVEQEPRRLSISFRSRTGFDTSLVAVKLGGGGHIYASGAKVVNLPFEEAVQKVLETARETEDENKS